jgi:hypothetical protein
MSTSILPGELNAHSHTSSSLFPAATSMVSTSQSQSGTDSSPDFIMSRMEVNIDQYLLIINILFCFSFFFFFYCSRMIV